MKQNISIQNEFFSIALVIKTVSDNEINIIQPNLLPELDINLMG